MSSVLIISAMMSSPTVCSPSYRLLCGKVTVSAVSAASCGSISGGYGITGLSGLCSL